MPDRPPLTEVEAKLLEFLRREVRARCRVPSWPEIATHFRWASTRSVGYHLENLEEKGYVRRVGGHRTLELVDVPTGFSLPVLGKVPAGTPVAPGEEGGDRFEFERVFGGEDSFMLRVTGESMIEAHIAPGDYVVIRRQPVAEDGETVVAMIDGEVTLKTFRLLRGQPWLFPANSTMSRIKLDPTKDTRVLGVMLGVVRKAK